MRKIISVVQRTIHKTKCYILIYEVQISIEAFLFSWSDLSRRGGGKPTVLLEKLICLLTGAASMELSSVRRWDAH